MSKNHRTMKARSVRKLVLLLVLTLISPACSDDGSDGGSGSTPSARATEQPTEASPGSSGALADADCREYANSFAGVSPDPNNPASFTNLAQIADSMEKIADNVPNEISDDFRVLAGAYREFAEGLGTLDFNDPSSFANVTPEELEKMEQSLKSLDQEEVRTAAANIEKFVKEHCPQG
jgi:hypothetical protein